MNSPNINESTFRTASGLWATGVSIVTTADLSNTPIGLSMSSVTTMSLKHHMLIICLDLGSDTMQPMLDRGAFCINILTEVQKDLSNRFAKKAKNKFDGVDWSLGSTLTPILKDSYLSIECTTSNVFEGGDHHILCGEVSELHLNSDPHAKPLIYFKGKYNSLAN